MRVLFDTLKACPRRSRNEWETIKPILLKIYFQPGVTLEDAMDILATEHDFTATRMMFKKRLHAWGVRKNLNANDKDSILDQAQLGDQTYHVRRKVNRYLREKGRRRKSQAREEDDEASALGTDSEISDIALSTPIENTDRKDETNAAGFSNKPSPTIAPLSSVLESIYRTLDMMLSNVKVLDDAHLTKGVLSNCFSALKRDHKDCPSADFDSSSDATETQFWYQHWVQELRFSYYVGAEALSLGLVSNAILHFRIAGRHLTRCLETPTQQLTVELLDTIRVLNLDQYSTIRFTVYRFLPDVVGEKLGHNHPLAEVIRLSIQHADDAEWQDDLWYTMSQYVQSDEDATCTCLRLQGQSYYGSPLESRERLQHAIDTNEKLFEQAVNLLGTAHEATRRTLFRLGRLYFKTKDYKEAMSRLERSRDILQQHPSRSPDDGLPYSSMAN